MTNNNTSKTPKKAVTPRYSPIDLNSWIVGAPLMPSHKATLHALGEFASKKNGYRVWPSQDLIAELAGLKLRRTHAIIGELNKLGYLAVEYQTGKGYQTHCEYTLNVGFCHAAPAAYMAEKMSKIATRNGQPHTHSTTENVSHSAYGATHSTTENVSQSAYEGEYMKEVQEKEKIKKVELLQKGKSPTAICSPDSLVSENGDFQEEVGIGKENLEKENLEKENLEKEDFQNGDCETGEVYVWAQNDRAAACALVWHDFFEPEVSGREIVVKQGSKVTPLGDYDDTEVSLCLEASRLASDYAVNAADPDSPARLSFYYQCGRLLFPKARKFSGKHKLPNGDYKLLNRIFDELGEVACYVVGRAMAEWKFNPKAHPRTNPDLSVIWENIDEMEQQWVAAMHRVEFPDEDWAKELLYSRFFPGMDQDDCVASAA